VPTTILAMLRDHPLPTSFGLARVARCAALAATIAAGAGCDAISSDVGDFLNDVNPPTPAEAAAWASDLNDPENQRRGLSLLSNAPWGVD